MMKRAIYTFPFLLAFIFAGTSTTQAQQQEIGYVDPQAILTKMPEMKAVQQRIQNFIADKQAELEEQRQEFQAALEEYQQKMTVMSAEAKAEEEKKLGQMQAELRRAQRQAQQAIQQKQQELVAPLIESINNAIAEVAQEKGLAYVLNTTTSNGDVIILYTSQEAQQKYDITQEVMDRLGI